MTHHDITLQPMSVLADGGRHEGQLVLADGVLLVMKTDGELVLIEPTPEEYRELARFRLFDSTTRALPALAEGLFYVRDSQTLRCFDLR